MCDYTPKPQDCKTSKQAHELGEQWQRIAEARGGDNYPVAALNAAGPYFKASDFFKREKELKAQGK